MEMNTFANQMKALLDMQNDYSRMKSENLLFRQQLEDAKKQQEHLVVEHTAKIRELSLGDTQKQTLALGTIYEIERTLYEWSDHIRQLETSDVENSNYSSREYYDREESRIDSESTKRYAMIEFIDTLLRKSAGLGV